MFPSLVFLIFILDALAFREKRHKPLPDSYSFKWAKPRKLGGGGYREAMGTKQKLTLFYLSAVAGFTSLFDHSLNCICNNRF